MSVRRNGWAGLILLLGIRPPSTCLLILFMFISLGILSEKSAMAHFLGSTAFLHDPVIRWIDGTGSKVSNSESIAGNCDCRKACLLFSVFFLGGVFAFLITFSY